MLATGRISAEDLDGVLDACTDPAFGFLSPVTMAGWGTRAADAP
jgi:hypothetical protein